MVYLIMEDDRIIWCNIYCFSFKIYFNDYFALCCNKDTEIYGWRYQYHNYSTYLSALVRKEIISSVVHKVTLPYSYIDVNVTKKKVMTFDISGAPGT